jgi:hypothetical protein
MAAVEGNGLVEGVRFRRQARKLDGVHLDPRRLERHRLPAGAQRVEASLPKCLTDPGQGLLQAVARLRLGAIAPQQAGEPLAGLRPPGRQRQIGKQQPVLAGRQG